MFEKQVAHFSQGASVLAVKKIAAFNSDLSPQRPLLVDQKLLHPVAPFYECKVSPIEIYLLKKLQGTPRFLWMANGFQSPAPCLHTAQSKGLPQIYLHEIPRNTSIFMIGKFISNYSIAQFWAPHLHIVNAKGLRLVPYKAGVANQIVPYRKQICL